MLSLEGRTFRCVDKAKWPLIDMKTRNPQGRKCVRRLSSASTTSHLIGCQIKQNGVRSSRHSWTRGLESQTVRAAQVSRMADITNLFKATIKTVKSRNKALNIGHDNDKNRILVTSRPKTDFAIKAKSVVSLYHCLKCPVPHLDFWCSFLQSQYRVSSIFFSYRPSSLITL